MRSAHAGPARTRKAARREGAGPQWWIGGPARQGDLGLWDDLRGGENRALPFDEARAARHDRSRVHEGMLRARLLMRMRVWPLLLVTACAAGSLTACVTQDDPPYGAPGAINNHKFPGEPATSSGTPAGDGGSSGAPAGFFPAAYNEANPAAPAEPLAPLHQNGVAKTPINSKIACMACHRSGGTSSKTWAYAGWAAAAPGSSTGLDKGEVLVIDGDKKLGPVKTSPDGYFWLEATAGTVSANAKAAVRDKTGKEKLMQQAVGATGSDCNNNLCHGNGAGPIDFQ